MRILISEDDAALAEALRFALTQSGFAVDWVANGLDADEALKGAEFGLLILDLGLPKIDGLEVLRRLRRRNSTVPVLILSGREQPEEKVELSFDPVTRTASISGHALPLSLHELSVLEVLIRRFGRPVSKEQLVEQIYTYDQEVSHNAIEVYVHRLRKKIGTTGLVVRTLYGRGYALDYVEQ